MQWSRARSTPSGAKIPMWTMGMSPAARKESRPPAIVKLGITEHARFPIRSIRVVRVRKAFQDVAVVGLVELEGDDQAGEGAVFGDHRIQGRWVSTGPGRYHR